MNETNWFLGKHFKIAVDKSTLTDDSKELIMCSLDTLDSILSLISDPHQRKVAMLLFLGQGTQSALLYINEFITSGVIQVDDVDKLTTILLDFMATMPEKLSNFVGKGLDNG